MFEKLTSLFSSNLSIKAEEEEEEEDEEVRCFFSIHSVLPDPNINYNS